MQNNHVYNLLKQFVREHKSLWRIKKNYIKEARGHADAIALWKRMEKDKEAHVRELKALIKKYLR